MSRIAINFPPFCIALATGLLLAAAPATAEETGPAFEREIQPFLMQHCYACHGPDKQEARIRYDRLDGYNIEQQHLWTVVHEKLLADEMPPDDRLQPTADEKKLVLHWIEQQSAAAQAALGTGSLRRLNRRELSAALQDLTGLSVNYADALPGDGKVNGFDTGAEGLQDGADSIAQVMRVTRRAVNGIYFFEPPKGMRIAVNFLEGHDPKRGFDAHKAFEPWKDDGVQAKLRGEVRADAGLFIEPKWVGERGALEIYVPAPPGRRGVLRLKLVVAVVKPVEGVPNPHLWVEVGAKDIDYREVTASPDKPQVLVYEVQLDDLAIEAKGVLIALSNKVEIPYGVKPTFRTSASQYL